MKASATCAAATLVGAAFLLSGYSGPTAVKSGPPVVPYLCEDGRPATAVYEHGGDYRHAKVKLTYDGHTSELRAAPAVSGMRYLGEGGAEGGHALIWSIRGEEGQLAEAHEGEDRPIARCVRVRSAAGSEPAAHGEDHDEESH